MYVYVLLIGIAAGIDIDAFAPRLSFFWGIGMNFYMVCTCIYCIQKMNQIYLSLVYIYRTQSTVLKAYLTIACVCNHTHNTY